MLKFLPTFTIYTLDFLPTHVIIIEVQTVFAFIATNLLKFILAILIFTNDHASHRIIIWPII